MISNILKSNWTLDVHSLPDCIQVELWLHGSTYVLHNKCNEFIKVLEKWEYLFNIHIHNSKRKTCSFAYVKSSMGKIIILLFKLLVIPVRTRNHHFAVVKTKAGKVINFPSIATINDVARITMLGSFDSVLGSTKSRHKRRSWGSSMTTSQNIGNKSKNKQMGPNET